jgi:hypothetical protein
VVEKVRSDQTCHTGANYSHLLLCFVFGERHLYDALQIPMKTSLQKSGSSSNFCGNKWRTQNLVQQNQTRTAQDLGPTRKKEFSDG